jgi:hypothetical protein
MSYRKGERPLPIHLDRWSPDHPLAAIISSGTHWFSAWLAQKTTPYHRLEALTGIPRRRLATIGEGGQISRAELDALARAWSISSGDLLASMPDPSIVID